MTDIFGNIIDADTVEQAVRDTLQAWLPAHLAHQERRRELDPGTLPQPRSWPMVSEFDPEVEEQLPSVFIASPGSVGTPERNRKGQRRKVWRFEIAVIVGGRTEALARRNAALYLAAVIGALEQNRTLGGRVENCSNVGPDDHALGTTRRNGQRAIYSTAFNVMVRDTVSDLLGTVEPPADPYNPGEPLPAPNQAEIIVTAQED